MGSFLVKLNDGTNIDVIKTISETTSAVEEPKLPINSNQNYDISNLKSCFTSMLNTREGKELLSAFNNFLKTVKISSLEDFILFLKNVFNELLGPISSFIDQWSKEIVEISKTILKVVVLFGFLILLVAICMRALPTLIQIIPLWIESLNNAIVAISFGNFIPAIGLLKNIVIL